jgi:hypothetical protein
MGYLKNTRCYLSGAIECDPSMINWRVNVKKELQNRFQIDIFDPFEDPKQQHSKELKIAKEQENYEEVVKIVKGFVRKDLSEVDVSKFLIARVSYLIPTVGTCHEIINSNNLKKPTLLVCEEGKNKTPSWYFGFISHKHIFGSWEDLYAYLTEVDQGKHMDNDRWSIIYKLL